MTQIIRDRCREVGAELRLVDEEWSTDVLERYVFGQSFLLHGPEGTRELRTPLLGAHQVGNAATAVAAAQELRARGAAIDDEAIAGGIARTRIAGRLEVMGQRPLVVADGAHNPAAAAALAEALREYLEWRRCFFVLGAMEGKDLRGIGYKLAGLASGIWCCTLASRRARKPAEMAAELAPLTPPRGGGGERRGGDRGGEEAGGGGGPDLRHGVALRGGVGAGGGARRKRDGPVGPLDSYGPTRQA